VRASASGGDTSVCGQLLQESGDREMRPHGRDLLALDVVHHAVGDLDVSSGGGDAPDLPMCRPTKSASSRATPSPATVPRMTGRASKIVVCRATM
jgi:hypothetical protein